MASDKNDFVRHVTEAFVAYWPQLFVPDEKTGKYAVVARFPKSTDTSRLADDITRAAKKKWPKGIPPKGHNPLYDQEEFGKVDKETQEFVPHPGAEPGGKWMRFTTRHRPDIYDRAGNEVEDETLIYPGAILQATLDLFAFSFKDEETGVTKNGVSCFLNSLLLVHPGQKLFTEATAAAKKARSGSSAYAVVTDEEAAKIAASAHF